MLGERVVCIHFVAYGRRNPLQQITPIYRWLVINMMGEISERLIT